MGLCRNEFIKCNAVIDEGGYSGAAIAFGLISLTFGLLLSVNIVRNFYKAWGSGAKGKNLVSKTLGISD